MGYIIMKKDFFQIIMISFIFLFLIFCGCFSIDYAISAEKLDGPPDFFITIPEEQMKYLPHLIKAINEEGLIDTPLEEFNQLRQIFNTTSNLKYLNNYYKISFASGS
jgi:hypothetical protein